MMFSPRNNVNIGHFDHLLSQIKNLEERLASLQEGKKLVTPEQKAKAEKEYERTRVSSSITTVLLNGNESDIDSWNGANGSGWLRTPSPKSQMHSPESRMPKFGYLALGS